MSLQTDSNPDAHLLGDNFSESEIVIGLVGAVGTTLDKITDILDDRLKISGYSVKRVSMSLDIIPICTEGTEAEFANEYDRISQLMDAGNEARRKSVEDSILALGAASRISSWREKGSDGKPVPMGRKAFIIKSLKHPAEASKFREIYPRGFHLIGVYADEKNRYAYLTEDKNMTDEQAKELMLRDQDEHLTHGQHVRDTFHMSDVFVRIDGDENQLKCSLWRFLEIIFAHPNRTPTFDEYAMFLAFSASLRSADLARQVGAVVARNNEVIAMGANDCPRYGGGLYWPECDEEEKKIVDQKDGRDYMRGKDANVIEQNRIIDDIAKKAVEKNLDEQAVREVLEGSRIRDLTEFGRVVHAEMEALLCCARNNISTRKATLYCTLFPCHNCAKHIIAAGIERVVYIEPYAKSKAADMHNDSLVLGFGTGKDRVRFEPFVGIGPRRFFDLFSTRLGSGFMLRRKNDSGQALPWDQGSTRLRLQMLPCSYLELELIASELFKQAIQKGDLLNA